MCNAGAWFQEILGGEQTMSKKSKFIYSPKLIRGGIRLGELLPPPPEETQITPLM